MSRFGVDIILMRRDRSQLNRPLLTSGHLADSPRPLSRINLRVDR